MRQEKANSARRDLKYVTKSLPLKIQRALDFTNEKGASSWLSVIPLKEINVTLNKREFRDAIKLRHGWEFNDIQTVCVCEDLFDADHAMICMRGGFSIQRHNKRCVLTLRWSQFSKRFRGKCCRGAPTRSLTRGWISVRVCHPNADSYKNLTPEQIYKLHENDKERLYSSRVLEVE